MDRPTSSSRCAVALLTALSFGACSLELSEQLSCARTSDCLDGFSCVEGTCTRANDLPSDDGTDGGEGDEGRQEADAGVSGPGSEHDGGSDALTAHPLDPTLWLRADRGVPAGDGPVGRWTDQSGRGFDALQSYEPGKPLLVKGAGPGGGDAVVFDGLNDHLTLRDNYLFSENDGMVFYLVLKSDEDRSEAENSDPIVLNFGSGSNYDVCLQYDYDTLGFRADAAGVFLTPHGVGAGKWALMTYQLTFGSDFRVRINGEDEASNTASAVRRITKAEIREAATRQFDAGPVTIGGQSKTQMQAYRFFAGAIAEIMVFDRALSKVERDGVECELARRHDIELRHACE